MIGQTALSFARVSRTKITRSRTDNFVNVNVFNSVTSPRVLSYRYVFHYFLTMPVGFNFNLRWNGTLYMHQKVCLNLVKKRPIVCHCTHEQKMNFEGFTQNGCYGNQPQPFEVVF